jgi:hypothetical protein
MEKPFGFDRRAVVALVYFIPGWTTRGGRPVFALPVWR